MDLVKRLWYSSLGKKYLMALSGCVLFLFVAGHMAGNLQFFLGREAINRYAHLLQTTPELLWPVRIVLVAMALTHLVTAIRLWKENRAARPMGYSITEPLESSYASRTMVMSGLIVAAFIVYHLLHFTAQTTAINLTQMDFRTLMDGHRHDVFGMITAGFHQPLVSCFYLVGVGLLCLHLRHGLQAWFQTLGLRNEAWRGTIDRLALAACAILFLGYASIPVAVLLGFGKEMMK